MMGLGISSSDPVIGTLRALLELFSNPTKAQKQLLGELRAATEAHHQLAMSARAELESVRTEGAIFEERRIAAEKLLEEANAKHAELDRLAQKLEQRRKDLEQREEAIAAIRKELQL
jgi:neutral trehalase